MSPKVTKGKKSVIKVSPRTLELLKEVKAEFLVEAKKDLTMDEFLVLLARNLRISMNARKEWLRKYWRTETRSVGDREVGRWRVFIHDTRGITAFSLLALAEAIARTWLGDPVAVYVYHIDPGPVGILGIAIIDRSIREIHVTGDGFRADRMGEGGAGLIEAERMLDEAGIRLVGETTLDFDEWGRKEGDPHAKVVEALRSYILAKETGEI